MWVRVKLHPCGQEAHDKGV